uniref:Uncharacterized protein n=1 Tax=Chaetoceros debilis TaxID=122233 RepID=A0A7S3VB10_9STRA
MFSANENLMLREHKRRVVQYVENTIPENLLDLGTTVMVMQTACRTPGCVPLETAIAVVFPRPMRTGGRKSASKTASASATVPAPVAKELLPGLKESAGGTFKTKILLPLAEVTKDDVLDSLPPVFEGGRKTWERTCMALRDMMIGRIGGMVGSGDTEVEVEERQILAEYLQQSLKDYLARGCVAPELNEPFGKLQIKNDNENDSEIAVGDLVIEEKKEEEDVVDDDKIASEATVVSGTMIGDKNFTIRRPMDDDGDDDDVKEKTEGSRYIHTTARPSSRTSQAATTPTATNMLTLTSQSSSSQPQSYTNVITNSNINTNNESAMDWRRRNNMTQSISLNLPSSSDGILQRLAEREHAPGVRSPGCPCCDPDSIQNVVDNMSVMF